MSIVIVGGNERMVCQYETICKCHGCKAKVFAKEKGALKKKQCILKYHRQFSEENQFLSLLFSFILSFLSLMMSLLTL